MEQNETVLSGANTKQKTTPKTQVGKRLPKYDFQSETMIDSCPLIENHTRPKHRNKETRMPTLVTPWPNQNRE